MGYKACASGWKEQEATNFLEKRIKAASENKETGGELSMKEAIETALLALQTVIGSDLKPTDLEMATITVDKPKWYQLTEAEVDAHLTALSDRD